MLFHSHQYRQLSAEKRVLWRSNGPETRSVEQNEGLRSQVETVETNEALSPSDKAKKIVSLIQEQTTRFQEDIDSFKDEQYKLAELLTPQDTAAVLGAINIENKETTFEELSAVTQLIEDIEQRALESRKSAKKPNEKERQQKPTNWADIVRNATDWVVVPGTRTHKNGQSVCQFRYDSKTQCIYAQYFAENGTLTDAFMRSKIDEQGRITDWEGVAKNNVPTEFLPEEKQVEKKSVEIQQFGDWTDVARTSSEWIVPPNIRTHPNGQPMFRYKFDQASGHLYGQHVDPNGDPQQKFYRSKNAEDGRVIGWERVQSGDVPQGLQAAKTPVEKDKETETFIEKSNATPEESAEIDTETSNPGPRGISPNAQMHTNNVDTPLQRQQRFASPSLNTQATIPTPSTAQSSALDAAAVKKAQASKQALGAIKNKEQPSTTVKTAPDGFIPNRVITSEKQPNQTEQQTSPSPQRRTSTPSLSTDTQADVVESTPPKHSLDEQLQKVDSLRQDYQKQQQSIAKLTQAYNAAPKFGTIQGVETAEEIQTKRIDAMRTALPEYQRYLTALSQLQPYYKKQPTNAALVQKEMTSVELQITAYTQAIEEHNQRTQQSEKRNTQQEIRRRERETLHEHIQEMHTQLSTYKQQEEQFTKAIRQAQNNAEEVMQIQSEREQFYIETVLPATVEMILLDTDLLETYSPLDTEYDVVAARLQHNKQAQMHIQHWLTHREIGRQYQSLGEDSSYESLDALATLLETEHQQLGKDQQVYAQTRIGTYSTHDISMMHDHVHRAIACKERSLPVRKSTEKQSPLQQAASLSKNIQLAEEQRFAAKQLFQEQMQPTKKVDITQMMKQAESDAESLPDTQHVTQSVLSSTPTSNDLGTPLTVTDADPNISERFRAAVGIPDPVQNPEEYAEYQTRLNNVQQADMLAAASQQELTQYIEHLTKEQFIQLTQEVQAADPSNEQMAALRAHIESIQTWQESTTQVMNVFDKSLQNIQTKNGRYYEANKPAEVYFNDSFNDQVYGHPEFLAHLVEDTGDYGAVRGAETAVLKKARDGVIKNIQRLKEHIDSMPAGAKNTKEYARLKTMYQDTAAKLVPYLVGSVDAYATPSLLDAKHAEKFAITMFTEMSIEEILQRTEDIDTLVGEWDITGQQEAMEGFMKGVVTVLRTKIQQQKEQLFPGGSSKEQAEFREQCYRIANKFREFKGYGFDDYISMFSPAQWVLMKGEKFVRGQLTSEDEWKKKSFDTQAEYGKERYMIYGKDQEFALETAMIGMGYDKWIYSFATGSGEFPRLSNAEATNKEPWADPLQQEVRMGTDEVCNRLRYRLGPQQYRLLVTEPSVRSIIDEIRTPAQTFEESIAKYALYKQLQCLAKDKPFSQSVVEQDIQTKLMPSVERFQTSFDTYLEESYNQYSTDAALLKDTTLQVPKDGRTNFETFATIRGFGLQLSDQNKMLMEGAMKAATKISVGIVVGAATGGAGFGMIASALTSAVATTATDAMLDTRGVANVDEAVTVYGSQFAKEAAFNVATGSVGSLSKVLQGRQGQQMVESLSLGQAFRQSLSAKGAEKMVAYSSMQPWARRTLYQAGEWLASKGLDTVKTINEEKSSEQQLSDAVTKKMCGLVLTIAVDSYADTEDATEKEFEDALLETFGDYSDEIATTIFKLKEQTDAYKIPESLLIHPSIVAKTLQRKGAKPKDLRNVEQLYTQLHNSGRNIAEQMRVPAHDVSGI